MMSILIFLTGMFPVTYADWPQWRGPHRNGVAPGLHTVDIALSDGALELLWESETFPDRGGEGSVVVSEGIACVLVNWRTEIPKDTRTINRRVLSQAGWLDVSRFPEGLLEKVEVGREELLRQRLRGGEQVKWIREWEKENLVTEQEQKLMGVIERRFKDRQYPLPVENMEGLGELENTTYDNAAALEAGLKAAGIVPPYLERIIREVPTFDAVAVDVLLGLNVETGETLWKAEVPGESNGNLTSGTPAIHDGRVVVAASKYIFCTDLKTGELLWRTQVGKLPAASSALIRDDVAYLMAGHLIALDLESGTVRWEQPAVKGNRSSPTWWKGRLLINTAQDDFCGIDAANGNLLWTVEGGGDASPVLDGSIAVVHSKNRDLGLCAYRLGEVGAELLWKHPLDDSRGAASPVIKDGVAYFLGGDQVMSLDVESGQMHWKETARAEITSPLLIGDKIVCKMGNGGYLSVYDTGTKRSSEIAKVRLKAARCPSPAYVNGALIVRGKENVAAYRLHR